MRYKRLEVAHRRVVGVGNADATSTPLGVASAELKELHFSFAVALKGAVVIEVLLSNIGLNYDVVRYAKHAVLRESVRAGLEYQIFNAGFAHLGEAFVECCRVGCGHVSTLRGNFVIDGVGHSGH